MAEVSEGVNLVISKSNWLRDLPRNQLLTVIVAVLWLGSGICSWLKCTLDPSWFSALEVFTGAVVVHYGANKAAEVKIAQVPPPPSGT